MLQETRNWVHRSVQTFDPDALPRIIETMHNDAVELFDNDSRDIVAIQQKCNVVNLMCRAFTTNTSHDATHAINAIHNCRDDVRDTLIDCL